MIKLYRIQGREDGCGPYREGFTFKWKTIASVQRMIVNDFMAVHERFPNLKDVCIPGWYYGCACRTLDKLKEWFSKQEYKTLLKYGFICVEIQADEILLEDEHQVVYKKQFPNAWSVKQIKLY